MAEQRRHRRVVRRSAVDHDPEVPSGAPVSTPGGEPVQPDRSAGAEPILPNRAAEDCDSAWGDGSDSNDRRLRDNVPPHW